MSPAWSTQLDIERVADEESELDVEIPLAELPRLQERLAGSAGAVRGRIRFRREAGIAVADVAVSGVATLTCQRCLGPVSQPVSSAASVALIAEETELERVPEHLEPVLAAGGRIKPAELIEEELLLALPIVPLHARSSECAAGSALRVADHDLPEATQRPFERLGELLKR